MKDWNATKEGGVRGMELINELSSATGLPDDLIGEELSRIISGAGKSTSDVTLDDLREMLAAYLQDVLLDAKDSLVFEEGALGADFDFSEIGSSEKTSTEREA